ncbi:MAG: RT0821/Lpp0805 family surface protein [Geminicoccales bacterium]
MASNARTDGYPAHEVARCGRRALGRASPLLVAAALFLCLAQHPLHAQTADVDRDYVLRLVNQALETARTDVEVPWSNPSTGHSGTIVIQRTFYLEPGKPCREYRRSVERPGESAIVIEGTGCRMGPEQWKLDEQEGSPVQVERPGASPAGAVVATAPDPSAAAGCPPAEAAAEPPDPEPPAFAEFTMPAKAKL